MSEADVLGRHVVLEIDESLARGGDFENRGRRRDRRFIADFRYSGWATTAVDGKLAGG